MTSYKLIKKAVSEDAIQHLSDKHDEERDDNPELARELDALCGKLNGEEQVEKEAETFLVVCATAVKETIEALSDIHDDMQDDNPDGAEEIDGVCGELQDSVDIPFLPSQALTTAQDALDDVIDGLHDIISRLLPPSGDTPETSQRAALISALQQLGSVVNGLENTDLLPSKDKPPHDYLEADEALKQLSSRNLGAPQ